MKKTILILTVSAAILTSCKRQPVETHGSASQTGNDSISLKKDQPEIINLIADMETEPVATGDDAADDACIWYNTATPEGSTIIGTNKKQGLVVYDLKGKQLFQYPVGRVNNVDIRDGFALGRDTVALVAATNRSDNTISVFKVNKADGSLQNVAARKLVSEMPEVYGFGMYRSPETGKFYGFITGKEGEVEQWEMFAKGDKVDGKIVRKFQVGSQTEGVVADDHHAKVYIGEENVALWKYGAEPGDGTEREKVASVTDRNMKSDFEGVTIYPQDGGKGYVILSSQGNNSYAVFDREENTYLGSFALVAGETVDGTYDTDGIDATSRYFNEKYPQGFFIAQDGANTQGKDTLNQNFKVIDWRKVAEGLHLDKH
ncbi:phytase [Sinomicrobium weinanense]|uniref:Phytase n=1 Tax=Sinomicrobium weinanense TaxID=2842200 RepID=A0A926JNW9_9FLAO|nr:phytase [Sinomicrobium weinanense]MBC9794613.1 phytase [Sinomicrobium weinanense]MBU3124098.1 phytase [Sinomicrobium weinanense]